MGKNVLLVLFVAIMVVVVVGIDVAFFKQRPFERLVANICAVLVFAVVYWRFFRNP
jgi:Mn2+/Fe2+ NRAMP family transporter